MKKTTGNLVKWNKLMEKIYNLKVKVVEKKTITYEELDNIDNRVKTLFDQYQNYVPPELKIKKQNRYFAYKAFVEGKK